MSPEEAARAKKTRQSVALGIGIAVVVGVASLIGTFAGRITQRAPHGGGARIVIVRDDDAPAILLDQVRRAAAAMTDVVTVVPEPEVEARRAVLRRKGSAGTIDEAATSIEADAVAYVHAGGARVVRKGQASEVAGASSANDIALAIAEKAGARVDDAARAQVKAWVPPTSSPAAYAALLERRYADAVAADADCASCLAGLGTKEALEKALGSPRLSRKEELMAEGAHARLALDAQTDPMKRAAVIEKILDIYRKMTVELPEEWEGHYNLGRTYHRLMNAHDESLHHLEAARRLVPTDLEITAEVADAWMHMADRKHAVQAVRGYLALFPDDAAAKKLLDDVTNAPLPTPPPPPSP